MQKEFIHRKSLDSLVEQTWCHGGARYGVRILLVIFLSPQDADRGLLVTSWHITINHSVVKRGNGKYPINNGLMGRSYIYICTYIYIWGSSVAMFDYRTVYLRQRRIFFLPRGLEYPHNSQEENGSKQPVNHWLKRFPSLNILKT